MLCNGPVPLWSQNAEVNKTALGENRQYEVEREGGGGVLEHIPAKSWKMKANICFQIHDIGLKMNPE